MQVGRNNLIKLKIPSLPVKALKQCKEFGEKLKSVDAQSVKGNEEKNEAA